MKTYKYEKEVIDGKEYLLMSDDLFYELFCETVKLKKNINEN